jgi:hypothetical protein
MEYIATLYELVKDELLDEEKKKHHFGIIKGIFDSYNYENFIQTCN